MEDLRTTIKYFIDGIALKMIGFSFLCLVISLLSFFFRIVGLIIAIISVVSIAFFIYWLVHAQHRTDFKVVED